MAAIEDLSESRYQVSAEALDDLFEIWRRISEDSVEIANRIEGEFYELFRSLSLMPGQGHTRKDLTFRPLLFFRKYSFLIVYDPQADPVRIMAVVRGKRNLAQILRQRP